MRQWLRSHDVRTNTPWPVRKAEIREDGLWDPRPIPPVSPPGPEQDSRANRATHVSRALGCPLGPAVSHRTEPPTFPIPLAACALPPDFCPQCRSEERRVGKE